jgi:hypothetical protein
VSCSPALSDHTFCARGGDLPRPCVAWGLRISVLTVGLEPIKEQSLSLSKDPFSTQFPRDDALAMSQTRCKGTAMCKN